jgi:predicted  nucleic acid-binding Zn-ribbon protein
MKTKHLFYIDYERSVIMATICMDCGCEDIRYDKLLGYNCNNCSCRDFIYFDKEKPSEYVKSLKEKYKQELENR